MRRGATATLHARGAARVMLLGGAALDGPRHIFWNFVSSSKDRIEQAKQDRPERAPPSDRGGRSGIQRAMKGGAMGGSSSEALP